MKRRVDQWLRARVAAEVERADREMVPGEGIFAVAVVFCTAAVALTLNRYFGGFDTFDRLFGPVEGDRQLWGYAYWSAFRFGTYVLLPWTTLRLFGLGTLAGTGFTVRGAREHVGLYAAMFAPVALAVVAVSASPSFRATYPFYRIEAGSAAGWLAFELVYALQFVWLEYFFRGYMIHVTKRRLGAAAVFAAMAPYCMIHFSKPSLETFASIVAGIVLGFVSLRTRSILGGCCVHIGVAWSMDVLALARSGQLGEVLALFGR